MSIIDDVVAFARAGVLRPLSPLTTLELTRQLVREGLKPHLLHTLHGLQTPDKPALLFEDRVTTWHQLLSRTRRLANHLLSLGIGPGSSVCIVLGNVPEFIEANAALMRVGATASFVNPRAPSADALAIAHRMSADLVITHRDDLEGVTTLRVGEEYEGALSTSSDADPVVERSARGRIVVFTSGTTGRPKGAVRSLGDATSPAALAGFLRAIPFRASDVHMVVCPLYHSSGSGFATVAQSLGNPLVIVERFSPQVFCESIERHRVTTTAVVPTMLHQIADFADAGRYDLSSLRVVVCTGAPLREEVRATARELLGDVVYDLYGSTESGWVSIASPDDQRRRPGTVGKPVAGIEVRIMDTDGLVLPPGEAGEIWTRSQLGMQGYVDDPELTAQRMRGGFVSVRDVGYLDGHGFLHVVDRADDMIISGGVNVYPAEAEIALDAHPKVKECAVLGVPDAKWGQRIVAAVVRDGDVAEHELITWSKQNASYAAVPKQIRFFEMLPRNDVGKVDKKKIAEGWDDKP